MPIILHRDLSRDRERVWTSCKTILQLQQVLYNCNFSTDMTATNNGRSFLGMILLLLAAVAESRASRFFESTDWFAPGSIGQATFQSLRDGERLEYYRVEPDRSSIHDQQEQETPSVQESVRLASANPIAFHRSNRRRSPLLDYKDVLQCTYPRSIWKNDARHLDRLEPTVRGDEEGEDDDALFGSDDDLNFESQGTFSGDRKRVHSPVVYRYYGRNRSRGQDSIPFILFGPNVDHWKEVGNVLSARGFNVIACERVQDDGVLRHAQYGSEDGPNLVLEILDALRWNRAVLVGCDNESIMAMETAMQLAPDRVAGLVLCGDLTDASQLASEAGVTVLDSFLRRIIDCPFIIVWDGDEPSLVSGPTVRTSSDSGTSQPNNRVLILGGGSAPHRRQPEQFAWVLTRFVEERLAEVESRGSRGGEDDGIRRSRTGPLGSIPSLFKGLPFGLESFVTSEGRLVMGRAIAAAIFYITIMKVCVIQYGLVRGGLIEIKARYESVDALRRRIFQAVASFFLNFGYIPRMFSLKKATEDDEYETLGKSSVGGNDCDEGKGLPNDAPSDSSEDPGGKTDESLEDSKQEPDKNENKDPDPPPVEEERPRFKPFFFLDQVVT